MPTARIETIDCEYLTPGLACAYLRVCAGRAAFIECNTAHALPRLISALERAGLAPDAVEALVVTHAHLDHAAGASAVLAACPNAVLYAHPRAARHLIDPSRLVASATKVYGADRFREMYGEIAAIPAARVRPLEDGARFTLGGSELRVMHTRGHANHHFVVLDPDADAVFTGDAFGLAYPALQRAGLFIFPSTSPTDFDPPAAKESVLRIRDAGMSRAMLTHFGEVWDLSNAAAQLLADLDFAERLLLDAASSSEPDEALVPRLRAALSAHIEGRAQKRGLTLTEADRALLVLDVDLNAQGIAFAALKRRGAG